MAFVKATIEFKPASVGTGIKCLLRKGKKSAAAISLYINAAVAKKANIADGDGIEVMIGEGEHHGLVRLRKNNSAANARAEGRSAGKGDFFLIKLGHQPAFVDRSEPGAWCKWETVEDGWIEIVLPRWADETKHGRKLTSGSVVAVQQPVDAGLKRADGGTNIKMAHTNINAVTAPRPKANVTANLMGDPPAGRREMLRKMGEMKP